MKIPFSIRVTTGLIVSATVLSAAPKVLPVLNNPVSDITVAANSSDSIVSLASVFGTEEIDDQVVRFTSQVSNGSRVMEFAMFSNRAPGTRTNFLKYVNDGDYTNSFIHRSMPGFVIQGGGFYDGDSTSGFSLVEVPTDAPIVNEFGISNTYGTVSMAKVGGDPDSATSQWFVSLGDNTVNLDNQNGGFTVFAKVTRSTMASAAAFGDSTQYPIWNAGGVFSNLPLIASFDNSENIKDTDLVLFPTVELVDIAAADAGESTVLQYSVVSNSSPEVFTASVSPEGKLVIDYADNASGSGTVTFRATDSVGNIVEDTIQVSVEASYEAWRDKEFIGGVGELSGPDEDHNSDGVTNFQLYVHGLSAEGSHSEPSTFEHVEVDALSYARYTFPLISNPIDVSYSLQKTTSLDQENSWVDVPFSVISNLVQGTTNLVTVQADESSSGDECFYRLVFSRLE